jgi:integrase
LEWGDIALDSGIISLKRASYYASGIGIYTDTLKTGGSYRSIKIPPEMVGLLAKYRDYQADYAAKLGDSWANTGRLFTAWDGTPLHPNSPYNWFKKFCRKNSLRHLSIHSFRHLNASILINAGVDVKTVQNVLGHTNANTTLNIYAHTFQTASARASKAVTEAINGITVKNPPQNGGDNEE